MHKISPDSLIGFHFQAGKFSLTNRKSLKAFIQGVFSRYKKRVESVQIVFCTDKQLLEINRQFLNHDYYTDIITFNLAGARKPIQAELYISINRVRENARTNQVSFRNELHRVIFHGILHLCGFNDKSTRDIKKIRFEETILLKSYL